MGLIACPDCKQQISDSASTCIHCGYAGKKKTPDYEGTAVGCISASIIIFLILYAMGGGFDDKSGRLAAPKQIVFNSSYDASVSQVEKWLKNNVRDPASLEFIEWSTVQKVESGFVVRVKYRAKNGFGGYVVENKLFAMDLKGDVLGCKDVE